MRTFLLIILSIASLAFTANAQTYFNKNFHFTFNEYLGDVIEYNGNYYANGMQNTFSNIRYPVFVIFNANGDTLSTNRVRIDSSYSYLGAGKTLLMQNNKFYDLGGHTDYTDSNKLFPRLIVRDINGDTLFMKIYKIANDATFQGGVFDKRGDLLVTGRIGLTPSNADVLLMKLDTLGNIVWQKTFGGGGIDEAYSIDTTADGGYIMAGYTSSYGAGQWDVYIVKTDSAGNFQWHKWFGSTQDDAGFIKSLSNGQYLVYGGNFVNGFNDQKGFIRKIDASGNLIWHKNVTNYGVNSTETFFSMDVLPDGGTYLAGMLVDFNINANNPVGYVVRVDSAGNEGYHRIYSLSQNDNYINDILATPDGGFVCSGYLFPDGNMITTQDGWIFKADSMGCLVANCAVGNEELEMINEKWFVYPNPASSELNIDFANDFITGTIRIFDVSGKLANTLTVNTNHTVMNITDLMPGVYVVQYSNNSGIILNKRLIITR